MTDYRRISAVVHGTWGTGKSWFANTMPGPRLILDAEGGQEDTPQNKVRWDMRSDLPKLGKDDSVIVDVLDWGTVEQALALLESGKHPFESVILDSFTELLKILKDRLGDGPDALFDQQSWGKLLANMETSSRRFRNLTRPSSPKRVNVVIVAATDTEDVRQKLLLQGGIRKSLPGFFDLVGYLSVEKTSSGESVRVLHIQPSDIIEAKCRLHKLSVEHGNHIVEPNFKQILKVVNT